jgi:hypothetical protein
VIASLPMYWRAENAGHWRLFWEAVQRAADEEGLDLPPLTQPAALPAPWTDHWLDRRLALSMTCGLPFRTVMRNRVTYVGTLDFAVATPAGHYRSVVIARPALPEGGAPVLAVNGGDSQSGWAAAQGIAGLAGASAFGGYRVTGAHAASLAAVAEGRADMACLDAVTWRMLRRFDPAAGAVRVLGETAPTPGLPLITAAGTDPAPLRRALATATAVFRPDDPAAMGGALRFHVLDPAMYHAVPVPPPLPVTGSVSHRFATARQAAR